MCRSHGRGRRSGVSVLEAVAALLLGLLLMSMTVSVLVRQRAVVATLRERADALATLRAVRSVLRREVRAGAVVGPQFGSDSLSVRAFRGTGTPCPGGEGEGVVQVVWWGVRAPAPAKDSVLLLTGDGRTFLRSLTDTEGGAANCAPDDATGPGSGPRGGRWTLSEPVPSVPIVVRYFERGSYHLSGRAFRYRRGAAGRQPLTPEALLTPESRFVRSETALRALLFVSGQTADLFLGRGAG